VSLAREAIAGEVCGVLARRRRRCSSWVRLSAASSWGRGVVPRQGRGRAFGGGALSQPRDAGDECRDATDESMEESSVPGSLHY
jgi:hypothetical protein